MSPSDKITGVLIFFAVLFDNTAFKAKLNSLEIPVSRCFEWVRTSTDSAVKELVERMELKVTQRNFAVSESQFLLSTDLSLCKLRIERVRQAPKYIRVLIYMR